MTDGASDDRPTLRIFAAASLQDVVGELAEAFQRHHSVEVMLNSAGSNVLAQQILATDGADIFISADRQWVDYLEERGRTAEGTRRDVLSNRLVVVGRQDAPYRLQDLKEFAELAFRHLALADPDGVPAGRYARTYLESVDVTGRPVEEMSTSEQGDAVEGQVPGPPTLWDAVADRVVPALDVRAAMALSETDPEILAVVYRTDALQSPKVQILLSLPPIPEVTIAYCATVVEGAAQGAAGRRFLDFLGTQEADEIVIRHGFDVL